MKSNSSANNSANNSAKSSAHYSTISEMEPMWPTSESHLAILEEKAVTLLKCSQQLSAKLHPITQRQIASLLRAMNSYYSNLIEGNVTHPLDVEKAQKNNYSENPEKRALQTLGKTHIEVQQKFEDLVRSSPDLNICSPQFLCDIHRSFYEKLPDEFRIVKSPKGKVLSVIPGLLRSEDVQVGQHVSPVHSSLPRFLERFEDVYNPDHLSSIRKIMAAAISHHRLVWIHPFLDGNGRVVRLFTHLYLMRSDIDSNGLWALSRGLARRREDYYRALEGADAARYNNYDGRGNLSEKGLTGFAEFILDVAIDQVQFMSSLLNIDVVLDRIYQYVELQAKRKRVDESAKYLLAEIFLRGEVSRSDVPRILGKSDRTAQRISQQLAAMDLVTSEKKLSPLRLNFPMDAVPIIFPSLYPIAGA